MLHRDVLACRDARRSLELVMRFSEQKGTYSPMLKAMIVG